MLIQYGKNISFLLIWSALFVANILVLLAHTIIIFRYSPIESPYITVDVIQCWPAGGIQFTFSYKMSCIGLHL